MSIKDLFRQTSNTIADLQAKYKSIESKKADLQKKADSIRAESLRADIPDASEQIKEISEEISLSDIALQEVRKALQAKIEKRVQSDYRGLNEQRLEYETKLNDLCRDAGKNTARAVLSLQALNMSFANLLGSLIRQTVIDYSEDRRFKNRMPVFLGAYSQSINVDLEPTDLRSWKKELQKIEGLRPGSPEAGRHVAARVKKLISAN